MKISVIVATYNWPSALRLSLQSLMRQTAHNFEIVVADDGSRNETRELIERLTKSSPVPIIHSWQEDIGFSLARSRNQAVLKSHGDYLILLMETALSLKTLWLTILNWLLVEKWWRDHEYSSRNHIQWICKINL